MRIFRGGGSSGECLLRLNSGRQFSCMPAPPNVVLANKFRFLVSLFQTLAWIPDGIRFMRSHNEQVYHPIRPEDHNLSHLGMSSVLSSVSCFSYLSVTLGPVFSYFITKNVTTISARVLVVPLRKAKFALTFNFISGRRFACSSRQTTRLWCSTKITPTRIVQTFSLSRGQRIPVPQPPTHGCVAVAYPRSEANHLLVADWLFVLVSSIRTRTLMQRGLERTETNLMHFKWEVTWTHGN